MHGQTSILNNLSYSAVNKEISIFLLKKKIVCNYYNF